MIDGRVAGYINYEDKGGSLEIVNIFIEKGWRRKGIGRSLVITLKGMGKPIIVMTSATDKDVFGKFLKSVKLI